MSEIKIEITIPDFEYKNWNDYHKGIEQVMANVKDEIRYDLKAREIQTFIIKAKVVD